MTDANIARPIGNTPITDAAAATAIDASDSYGSNADLRVAEDRRSDAAITATGEDIDNDHADERPIDRSQDGKSADYEDADAEQLEKQ